MSSTVLVVDDDRANLDSVCRIFQKEGVATLSAAIGQEALEHLRFKRFSLQPMDGPAAAANTKAALELCLQRPRWQLSLQTHKMLGIR